MDLDGLVIATAGLQLGFRCCEYCCSPRYVSLPGDPPEETLSALAKRKFYVIKKGAPNGEGIYSDWGLAQPHIIGISGALHESCKTADDARRIWAGYCHAHHTHPPPHPPPHGRAPPPYTPVMAPSSSCLVTTQRTGSRPAHSVPTTPTCRRAQLSSPVAPPATTPVAATTPDRFYRVAGSPHVRDSIRFAYLITPNSVRFTFRADAEAELNGSGEDASLLVGNSLAEVEDSDKVTPADTPHFYRVFGSPCVQRSREAALRELVVTRAAGLLVGTSLDSVDI
ncbi:hypothetical protein K438DRAFT_1991766 [Mycena galopus ATCC 62051]|nr:hypothetical protein K438DRAFT_1991766 [Mycena galopus ATCC 62051]